MPKEYQGYSQENQSAGQEVPSPSEEIISPLSAGGLKLHLEVRFGRTYLR